MTESSHTVGQNFRVDAVDRLLRRGVDIEQIHVIGAMKGTCEIVHQMHGSRIPMRLENREDAFELTVAGCRQSGPNLGRMVAIIVDDRDASFSLPAAESGGPRPENLASPSRISSGATSSSRAIAIAAVAFKTL